MRILELMQPNDSGRSLVPNTSPWPDYYGDVRRFNIATSGTEHARASVGFPDNPQVTETRLKLIEEEVTELREAIEAGDIVEVADALADILYVTFGAFAAFGIDPADVHREVHRSNMAKLVDGKVIRRGDGKVLKPEGWTPPDIAAELRKQGADV
jgi:predicted HAD superfamily Cof-like phosphohydrolase